ncbi:MAG: D-aminoacyl-tRNA deacylase [bacterium]|jgi:D-tyrosyl-tRNA(Tyr) deacylase
MRAVVQRVSSARVRVEDETVGEIGRGFVILLGVSKGDTEAEARWLAKKCAGLRIFEDSEGLLNLGLGDVGGKALVVSQFTLYGDCEKGRRPSFTGAAPPEEAERLYRVFVGAMRAEGIEVQTGTFQAKMLVEINNDGPVTLIIDR